MREKKWTKELSAYARWNKLARKEKKTLNKTIWNKIFSDLYEKKWQAAEIK